MSSVWADAVEPARMRCLEQGPSLQVEQEQVVCELVAVFAADLRAEYCAHRPIGEPGGGGMRAMSSGMSS